jgi:hypothetical protein
MANSTRDEFPTGIIDTLRKRAAFICSNPNCRNMTIAASEASTEKVQYIGVAAHITSAAAGGPRYDTSLTPAERQGVQNGIYLCNNCATLVDKNNGIDYSVALLKELKATHEKWVLYNLNKSIDRGKISVQSSQQNGGITASQVFVERVNFSNEDDEKTHDRKIFNYNNQFFNETEISQLQNLLDGSPTLIYIKGIEFFSANMGKLSNEYLNVIIEASKQKLLAGLKRYLEYERKPDESEERLHRIINEIKEAFTEYRKNVKKHLQL